MVVDVLANATLNATNSTINSTANSTANAFGNISINATAISNAINSTINNTISFVDKTASSGSITSTLVFAFIGIVVLIFVFALFMKGLNLAITLALNSIIGFFALYAIQLFLLPSLVIDIWSIAIVAILGLAGMIIVLLMHGLGFFF